MSKRVDNDIPRIAKRDVLLKIFLRQSSVYSENII